MAGDDDDPVRVARAALDGDDILDHGRVGDARRPVTVSRGRTICRQPPQAREKRWNSLSVQFSAAPMPRVGSVCDDSVWRVPKLDQPLDRRAQGRFRNLVGEGVEAGRVGLGRNGAARSLGVGGRKEEGGGGAGEEELLHGAAFCAGPGQVATRRGFG